MSSGYSPDLDPFVKRELANGPYQSEGELLTAALKVYRELKMRHSRLREDVQRAIADADEGMAAPLDVDALKG